MKTQTIEVEGLTEGFEVKILKIHMPAETLMQITKNNHHYNPAINIARVNADVVLEKIQPRRIVLEETAEYHEPEDKSAIHTQIIIDEAETAIKIMSNVKWKRVKETDITLTNNEPKLSLTKKDMLDLIDHLKLGGRLNPKIAEFIDYDQPEPKLSLRVDECRNIITGSNRLGLKIDEFIKENS